MINSGVNVFRAWVTAAEDPPYATAQKMNERAMLGEQSMIVHNANQDTAVLGKESRARNGYLGNDSRKF
jgi:hypothetical protein